MRIALCLYSATGNTRYLARALAGELADLGHEAEIVGIPARPGGTVPFDPDEWDRVGFAFPVMAFRPPFAVERFLRRMKPRREAAPAFALLTCGGMAAHTGRLLARALAEKNLPLFAVREFVCEDSYIPFRKWLRFLVKRGKPDPAQAAEARDFAALAAGEPAGNWKGPGGIGRAVFHAAGQRTQPQQIAALLGTRHLEAGACVRCGRCARECPTGAITIPEGGVPNVAPAGCVGCCACFNNCPGGAWRLDRFDARWFYRFRRSEEQRQ